MKRIVYLQSAKKAVGHTNKKKFYFFFMWGCQNQKAAYICNRFQKMKAQKVH